MPVASLKDKEPDEIVLEQRRLAAHYDNLGKKVPEAVIQKKAQERVIARMEYIPKTPEELLQIDKDLSRAEYERDQLWEHLIKLDADEFVTMATDQYFNGSFIQYAEHIFSKIWVGDSHILRALMYVASSFRLKNPDEGIHLGILGNTQVGKSDSVKSSLKLLSVKDQLTRTFSEKWLFYAEESGVLHENCIVFSDEGKLSEEIAPLYRNILTSWDTGVTRGTVKNQEAIDLHIPKHVSLVLTSVDSIAQVSDEGQDESRFLILEVRRTKEQEQQIRDFIQEEKENITPHQLAIRRIWECIPRREVTIHKKITDALPIRELKRKMTLLKCHALLCNRDVTCDEDFIEIDKFLTYSKPMIDSQTPAYKRDEQVIMDFLNNNGWQTTDQIQAATNLPIKRVYRALRGEGTFDRPDGGLMATVRNLKMDYSADTRKHSFKVG